MWGESMESYSLWAVRVTRGCQKSEVQPFDLVVSKFSPGQRKSLSRSVPVVCGSDGFQATSNSHVHSLCRASHPKGQP